MSTHLEAVEESITTAGSILDGRHTALLVLIRTLARQMDAAGPDPSTRLSAAYLSTLKDLGRLMAAPPAQATKPRNGLAAVRAIREAAEGAKVTPKPRNGLASVRGVRESGPTPEEAAKPRTAKARTPRVTKAKPTPRKRA